MEFFKKRLIFAFMETKVLIINAAQNFAHSGGALNNTLTQIDRDFFNQYKNFQVQVTAIQEGYSPAEEVEKWLWADTIVYHTPVWWFSLPFLFKRYIDEVFSAGYGRIYKNDGRTADNPKRNYGKGGLLQGRNYMLVSTLNAPLEAFTLENEFFLQKPIDEAIFFGFHRMNTFIGLEKLDSFHFYDAMKNFDWDITRVAYQDHLKRIFISNF